MTNKITAINYDERYYLNDKDFTDTPVDDTPIYIRYDQLDLNLARLYQMQRGELPMAGEINFVVEPGVMILSSSAFRPLTELIYKHWNDRPSIKYIVPEMREVPAIDTGEFPPDLVVNLIVKGAVVARGGSGGGATPSGISTKYNYAIQGAPGGGGAPFGRVLTDVPISQEVPQFRSYFNNDYQTDKISDAQRDIPGSGYQRNNGDSVTPLSGNGGGWGQRGTKSINAGEWNWRYHGTLEGEPGPGGAAIIGALLLNLQIINGGQILQTL